MQDFSFQVDARAARGSSAVAALRRSGLLPAVAYAHGEASFPIQINQREFNRLAETSQRSQVFMFRSSVKELDGRSVIVKDIQLDHLSDRVLHVDFQLLRDDEEISVQVPLKTTGDAYGVKNESGILSVAAHELSITCLPRHIPRAIEVDIVNLRLGETIHAKDLPLPEGVRLAGNPGETIVSVVAPKTVAEDTAAAAAEGAAAEGAAPAEGAAAAPAEGEAAAGKGEKKG